MSCKVDSPAASNADVRGRAPSPGPAVFAELVGGLPADPANEWVFTSAEAAGMLGSAVSGPLGPLAGKSKGEVASAGRSAAASDAMDGALA